LDFFDVVVFYEVPVYFSDDRLDQIRFNSIGVNADFDTILPLLELLACDGYDFLLEIIHYFPLS